MNDEYISSQIDGINQAVYEIRDLIKEAPALRDQFAMAALTGMLAEDYSTTDLNPSEIASDAYGYADAMLKAREVKP